MDGALASRLDTLHRQKAELLDHLSNWNSARLQFRPEPQSWSALHVVDHLVKTEQAFVEAMHKNLGAAHTVGPRERFGAFIVRCVMRSPMRVKTPASAVRVLPNPPDDLPEILRNWDATRGDLASLLAPLNGAQLRNGLAQHPVSGWLTPPLVLDFLSSHLRHHKFQMDRLAKASLVSGS